MASIRRRGRTIAELEAEQRASSNYTDVRRSQEEEYARQAEERRRIQAPVVAHLQQVGVPSLDAILGRADAGVNLRALPVLLEHLQRPYPATERAFIAHLLAFPEARVAWRDVVDAYKREHDALVRDGLANVLAAMADESVLDEYLQLVRDTSNGPSRVLLLRTLGRLRIPRGIATLRQVSSDPELRKEATAMLRRIDRKKS